MNNDHDFIFRVNQRDIAAKMIDGEVILINLVTGVYYSLDGVGAQVWSLIEQRATTHQIGSQLMDRYHADGDKVIDDVEGLLSDLLSEQLVSQVSCEHNVETFTLPDAPQPYRPPTLEVYTDMSDLLALDPPLPGLSQTPRE